MQVSLAEAETQLPRLGVQPWRGMRPSSQTEAAHPSV